MLAKHYLSPWQQLTLAAKFLREANDHTSCRVVGVTQMIKPSIGRKIVKDLIIKWDPGVDVRRLIYESYVVFRAGSFYDSPEVRFCLLRG